MTKQYRTQARRDADAVADIYLKQEAALLSEQYWADRRQSFSKRIKSEAAALLAQGHAPTDCAVIKWEAFASEEPLLSQVIPFEEAKQTRPTRFLLGNLEVGVV